MTNDADLDAPPEDKQWAALSLPAGASYDFEWYGTHAAPVGGAQAVVVKTADATTCANATGYSTSAIEPAQLKIGSYVCVFTSEKRYSLLKVTGTYADSNRIDFNVTTFKNASD